MTDVHKEKADFDQAYKELAEMVGFDEAQDTVCYVPGSYVPEINPNVFTQDLGWQTHYHPYREAWIDSDIQVIERVRKLGRFLIEETKTNLANNEAYQRLAQESYVAIASSMFVYDGWQSHHEQTEDPVQMDREPVTVINPKNIKDWPRGDYLNCLGVSVGLAAIAELKGVDYLYTSELIEGNSSFFANFIGLENKIRKLYPAAYSSEKLPFKTIFMLDICQPADKDRKNYQGMPISNPPAYSQPPEYSLRDYHHFVVANLPKNGEDLVAQIDPYNYAFRALPTLLGHNGAFEAIKQSISHDSTTVITDDTMGGTYKILSDTLDEITSKTKASLEADSSVKNVYEAAAITENILAQSIKDIVAFCSNWSDVSADEYAKDIAKACLFYVLDAQYVLTAEYLGLEAQMLNLGIAVAKGDINELIKTEKEIKDVAQERNQYDSTLQALNEEMSRMLPISMFMMAYRCVLQDTFKIRDTGVGCSAMEIAEPDFMIGAMALNHYANNRKDGRINVARYLSRYSTSQLLWASAVIGDENESVDPSVMAVGGQVASLKANQQHPRVRLISKTT